MDMETIHRIREHNEADDTGYSPLWFIVIGLLCAFFWYCAVLGFSPAAYSVARVIQYLGQPLAEVLR